MTVNDLISRVRSLYNKGPASNDSRLSTRHIYSKIKSSRNLLLRREADKKRRMSDWNIQTIECMKLALVPPNECPCIVPQGCKMLKTLCKVPKPLQTILGSSISSVTTMDGSTLFGKTNWIRKRYKSGDKYTSEIADYFIRDEYLWITHNKLLEWITISGIFEDPVEVELLPYNGDCSCACKETDCCPYPPDLEFPVDSNLVDAIVQMSAQELVQLFKSIPEDTSNDASEKLVGTPPQPQRQPQR